MENTLEETDQFLPDLSRKKGRRETPQVAGVLALNFRTFHRLFFTFSGGRKTLNGRPILSFKAVGTLKIFHHIFSPTFFLNFGRHSNARTPPNVASNNRRDSEKFSS
jgi:hypothetical protein